MLLDLNDVVVKVEQPHSKVTIMKPSRVDPDGHYHPAESVTWWMSEWERKKIIEFLEGIKEG